MTDVDPTLQENLQKLLTGLRDTAEGILARDGEFPTTYIFFKEDGEPLGKISEPDLRKRISDEHLALIYLKFGIDPDEPADAEKLGKALHTAAISFTRYLLAAHDEVHYLAIIGEVWVTHMEGEKKGKQFEAMHFVVHHRSGEFVIATQDFIRPAGRPIEYFGEMKQTDPKNHEGELTMMFPCQLERPRDKLMAVVAAIVENIDNDVLQSIAQVIAELDEKIKAEDDAIGKTVAEDAAKS